MKILLASASPRRSQLLEQIHADFSVQAPDIDETPLAGESSASYVLRMALAKAEALLPQSGVVLIAADTTLDFRGAILGKADDAAHAVDMLTSLSGKKHTVLTGVAIIDTVSGRSSLTVTRTSVFFRKLDREQIISYVSRERPFDCAGSYRIQDLGTLLVRKIQGSYTNVVGFPLETVYGELVRMGFDLLRA